MLLSLQKGMWERETSDTFFDGDSDCCRNFCGNGGLHNRGDPCCPNAYTDGRNCCQQRLLNTIPRNAARDLLLLSGEIVCKKP